MKQLALEYFTQTNFTAFALVLFLLVFLVQFIRVFLMQQNDNLERAALLPLEGDKNNELQ